MFYNYFLEIKNRCMLVICSWCATVLTCYLHKTTLLFLLIKLNLNLHNTESFYFIFTNLTDVFTVYLQISYFISNQFLVLIFVYHFLMFIAPGLFKFEYNLLKYVSFNCFNFFLISILILNYFTLPMLWSFFLGFQESYKINIFFESKITEYFNFYITLYTISVVIGQFFGIILVFFSYVKFKKQVVLKSRKVLYTIFFIAATLMTPPDVVSQIVIGFCFIFVYEFLILFILFKTKLFNE